MRTILKSKILWTIPGFLAGLAFLVVFPSRNADNPQAEHVGAPKYSGRGPVRLATSSAVAADVSPEENPGTSPETLKAHLRKLRAGHEKIISDHGNEARDSDWATQAEKSMSKVLGDVAQAQNARLLSLDCRRKTCLAMIQWPSPADAVGGHRAFLHAQLDPPCGTQILLRDQDIAPQDRPYTEELILRCDAAPLFRR